MEGSLENSMKKISRHEFLKSATAGLLFTRDLARATPLGLPIGLQPYTVRNDLKADFEGTLRKVAAMGYKEIEVSGGEGSVANAFSTVW